MNYFSIFIISIFGLLGSNTYAEIQNIEAVKKISFLLASSKGLSQSAFGHASVRISYLDKLSPQDSVVQFLADVDLGSLNIFKGMGIGENYDFKIAQTKYKNYAYENIISEDRDITIYELNLDDSQILEVLEDINGMINGEVGFTYSFFIRNCVTPIRKILDKHNEINGLAAKIPLLFGAALKKMDLVKSITVDERGSLKRERKVYDFFKSKELEKYTKEILYKNLKKNLISYNQSERIFGLMILSHLMYDLDVSKELKEKIYIFSRRYIILERKSLHKDLILYFKKEKSRSYDLKPFVFNLSKDINLKKMNRMKKLLRKNKEFQNLKTKITAHNSKVFMEYSISGRLRKSGRPGRFNMNKKQVANAKFPIDSSLSKGLFRQNNMILGRKFSKGFGANGLFFPQNLLFSDTVITNNDELFFISILVNQKRDDLKKEISRNDIISIKNGYKLNGKSLAICATLIKFQELLLERVIFSPGLEKLSKVDYMKLISDLFNDKLVVIPGFSDILSFTSFLDQDALAIKLFEIHDRKHSWLPSAISYFNEMKFTKKIMRTYKNIIAQGNYFSLNFEVEYPYAHSVLVTSINEDDDFYYLKAFDPNLGYDVGEFKISKKTYLLDTTFYRNKRVIRVNPFDLKKKSDLSILLHDKKNKDLMILLAEKLKRYSFNMSDLYY